jgi:hypothetical protein
MTRSLAAVMMSLFAFACAQPTPTPAPVVAPAAPAPVSAAALQDHYGDSTETAVPVPPVDGDEVKFENEWIYDRFGRFRRLKFAVAHQNDRHYDVITIELPDHSEHTVYFDITDLWAKWGKS